MDEDALRGLFWGGALGDALGAPHEFRTGTPLRYYTGWLEFPVVRQNQWQGRRVGVVAQISDDTEMMLALASTLVVARRFDRDRVIKAYMAWANSGCPFMGNNTRGLLHGVKTVRGYEGRYRKTYENVSQRLWSQSNGCLMRCAPLAALGRDNALAASRADCALTNPHPVCVDACQVYIRAACELGVGGSPEDIVIAAPEWAETDVIRNVLVEAGQVDGTRDVTGESKGWIVHSLWCAFHALAILGEEGTYEDMIDWVIRLSGDTDTNACITGALLGAYFGYEVMESEDRSGANIGSVRDADPSLGGLDRPAEFRASRIDQLVRGLHNVLL